MKKIAVLVFFLLLSLLLTSCNDVKMQDPEIMQKMITEVVQVTNKAIENKDLKTVRAIWGKISEYGVKAEEMGLEDLSKLLGQTASTYVYLIEYIEKGDVKQLDAFNEKFKPAISSLEEYVAVQKEKRQKHQ